MQYTYAQVAAKKGQENVDDEQQKILRNKEIEKQFWSQEAVEARALERSKLDQRIFKRTHKEMWDSWIQAVEKKISEDKSQQKNYQQSNNSMLVSSSKNNNALGDTINLQMDKSEKTVKNNVVTSNESTGGSSERTSSTRDKPTYNSAYPNQPQMHTYSIIQWIGEKY